MNIVGLSTAVEKGNILKVKNAIESGIYDKDSINVYHGGFFNTLGCFSLCSKIWEFRDFEISD